MTTTALTDRRLGRRGPITSALGMGTWAIGGPWQSNGRPAGWGEVDDAESIRSFAADCVAALCRRLIDGGVPALHFYTLNLAKPTLAVIERLR